MLTWNVVIKSKREANSAHNWRERSDNCITLNISSYCVCAGRIIISANSQTTGRR